MLTIYFIGGILTLIFILGICTYLPIPVLSRKQGQMQRIQGQVTGIKKLTGGLTVKITLTGGETRIDSVLKQGNPKLVYAGAWTTEVYLKMWQRCPHLKDIIEVEMMNRLYRINMFDIFKYGLNADLNIEDNFGTAINWVSCWQPYKGKLPYMTVMPAYM